MATTPRAELRRDLIDLLGRHDGHIGLYAEGGTEEEPFAINADEEFPVGRIAGDSFPGRVATLRELTRRLARGGESTVSARSERGEEHQYIVLFERRRLGDGPTLSAAVACDRPAANATRAWTRW